MASNDPLLHALEQQREESREQFSELRTATAELTKSVSSFGALVARSEERHLRQDDGLKRMGKQLDDHESRIRLVETDSITQKSYAIGGWKVATVVAAVISAAVTIGIKFL